MATGRPRKSRYGGTTPAVTQPAGPAGTGPKFGGSGREKSVALSYVAISPDGRWVITGDFRQAAFLWDMHAENPATSGRLLEVRTGLFFNSGPDTEHSWLGISPDGHWAVTGSDNERARLWNLRAPDPAAAHITLPAGNRVHRVAFSPDSKRVVTGANRVAHVWDLTANDPAASATLLPDHSTGVDCAAFSGNRWVITGTRTISPDSNGKAVSLWDLESQGDRPQRTTLQAEQQAVIFETAGSPDGRWVAARDLWNIVRIWDLQADPPGSTSLVIPHLEGGSKLEFSSSNQLIVGQGDGTITMWDPVTAPREPAKSIQGKRQNAEPETKESRPANK